MSVVIHSSNVRDVRSRGKISNNVTGKRIHKPKMRFQNLTGILLSSCLLLTPEGHRGRSKVPSKYFDDYRQNQISHKNEVDDIDEKRDEKCMTCKIFPNQQSIPKSLMIHPKCISISVLSLFSIVQFKNEPCRSTSTLTGYNY